MARYVISGTDILLKYMMSLDIIIYILYQDVLTVCFYFVLVLDDIGTNITKGLRVWYTQCSHEDHPLDKKATVVL